MALYFYDALLKTGKKTSGIVDAPSLSGARELILKQGMYPVDINVFNSDLNSNSFFKNLFIGSVSLKDKILFTKQLSVLLKSGVPILSAIELLIEQFEGRFSQILVKLKDGLKEGSSLADGLKNYPDIFENIYVQLVKAGEASGKLEMILDRLVLHLERRDELKKKISSALFLPAIQLIIIFLVTIFLATSVVPKLTSILTARGGELPFSTTVLLALSNFLVNNSFLCLFSIISIILLVLYWKSTQKGIRQLDKLKLKLPIFKVFARLGAVVQFCNTLGMLLEAGVILSQALDIVVNVIDNTLLKDALNEAREKIIKQGNIAQYLKNTKIFPPIAIYLISTGEQSGNLDYMLLTVAENYESDLKEFADNLAKLLDPIIMIVMALVVGFIVMAVAVPMANMGGAV